jgi:hypothetical protein
MGSDKTTTTKGLVDVSLSWTSSTIADMGLPRIRQALLLHLLCILVMREIENICVRFLEWSTDGPPASCNAHQLAAMPSSSQLYYHLGYPMSRS